MPTVIQEWACSLPFMQQAVLMTAVRGPDGLHKNHISKQLLFWLRRCFLISAFTGRAVPDPINGKDKSFTGAVSHPDPAADQAFKNEWFSSGFTYDALMQSQRYWQFVLDACATEYLRSVDEMPHHFHWHLMHAAEILGYKHPEIWIQRWWNKFYLQLVNDAHLHPETREEMDKRLADNEANWREREVVEATETPRVHP